VYSYTTLINATIDGNRAGIGGGIYVKSNSRVVIGGAATAIHGNVATEKAGGLACEDAFLTVPLAANAWPVAGNSAPDLPEVWCNSGSLANMCRVDNATKPFCEDGQYVDDADRGASTATLVRLGIEIFGAAAACLVLVVACVCCESWRSKRRAGYARAVDEPLPSVGGGGDL